MPVGKSEDVKLASGEVVKLKTNFKTAKKLGAFYCGGQVELSRDGQHLFATCGSRINVVSCSTGLVERSIEEEEDHVTSIAVSSCGDELAVGWRSLLIKQYNLTTGKCKRSWKGHLGPVVSMAFDSTATLLASGSSDSTVKVWDVEKQYCTHNLRGSSGVVHLVQFHPSPDLLQLFTSAAVECSIRVWDLRTSTCVQVLRGHVSSVTSLGFAADGVTLLSGGRDQVVHVWNLASGTINKTIPVFESVEGVAVLPVALAQQSPALGEALHHQTSGKKDAILFATAGSKGCIRLWSSKKKQPLLSLEGLMAGGRGGEAMQGGNGEGEEGNEGSRQDAEESSSEGGYTGLHYNEEAGQLVAITYDQNIIFYNSSSLEKDKQLVGYLDEVVDMRFAGATEDYLVVANNSEQVKVFHRESSGCQFLVGHRGVVLSLDVTSDGCTLVTGSKDNSVRMWKLDEGSGKFRCVGVGTGHTHIVGAVAVSRVKGNFLVSGSQDCTLKCWTLKKPEANEGRLKVKYTQHAHDKDINSIDMSPNDKLIVTGSQDKTAKLWQVSGEQLGTFRGHKRGLWSVRFSPVDQCVLTASADATMKLWAIGDYSCIKTFEGHTNSVLKALFISRGMQIASSGSDGLVKIWTIKTNECVSTLDEHTEKVWSLASSADGNVLVSGGADSVICQWTDVTEEVVAEMEVQEEELLLREQELSNYLHQKNFVKAVGVAITLDQPFRIFNILQELLERCGQGGEFCTTICLLREDQIHSLVRYASHWNQNSRHSYVAQSVLGVLLRSYPPEKLLEMEDLPKLLEGLIPYTERHMQRLLRLQQLSKFVDYTLQTMKLPTLQDPRTSDVKLKSVSAPSGAVDEVHTHSAIDDVDSSRLSLEQPDSTTTDLSQTPDKAEEIHSGLDDHVTSTTLLGAEKVVSKKPRRLKRKALLKAIARQSKKFKSSQ